MYRAGVGVILKQGQVNEWRAIFGQTVVFRVASHANDLSIEFLADKFETLADGFLIGPKPFGHGLVNHNDLRGAFSILLAEIAASQERDAQRLKKLQAYVVDLY